MEVTGKGALGVWHGVTGPQQREVEEWYNREHHAERVAIPGFLRARRYVNRGAGLRYFSRYDTVDSGVLGSTAYLHALNNPSPWSQKIFPHYRGTVRGAFDVVGRFGTAEGGYLTSLRFDEDVAPASDELLDLARQLAGQHGVLSAEVWRIDRAATTQPTREKALRATKEFFPAQALLIDASAPEFAAEALSVLAGDTARSAVTDVYQLVFQKLANGSARGLTAGAS
jgi:hypothetical protein